MEYAQIQLEVIHVNAKLDSKGTEEVVQILMNVLMERIDANNAAPILVEATDAHVVVITNCYQTKGLVFGWIEPFH